MPASTRWFLSVLAAAVLLSASGTATDGQPALDSHWAVTPPAVDGDRSDWSGLLTSMGAAPASIGVQNDGSRLYIALVTSDPGVRALLSRAGFTLWWDPSSREKRRTGMYVPPIVTLVAPAPRDDTSRAPRRPGKPEARFDPIAHIEVIGPGKDDRRRFELTYARTIGIDAVASLVEDVLVYEMAIPLQADDGHPYAIAAPPGTSLVIGLDTEKIPAYRPPDSGGRGGGRGGFGGFGGFGRGGGGGGRGGRGGPEPEPGDRGGDEAKAKPIHLWLPVHVSAAPAQ